MVVTIVAFLNPHSQCQHSFRGELSTSRMKKAIAAILQDEGFVRSMSI